jgi:transcriptional regulator with XRE-family HTH domain
MTSMLAVVDAAARRFELRNFLMASRARLQPGDVGLPSGRRRVSGLRREEVAELAGVSSRWYALFESGSSDRRFSAEFVDRLADALRLDEGARATLFRLALPEVAAATEIVERGAREGALQSIAVIRDLSRRVVEAASLEEAARIASEAVQPVVFPNCATIAGFEKTCKASPHADRDHPG